MFSKNVRNLNSDLTLTSINSTDAVFTNLNVTNFSTSSGLCIGGSSASRPYNHLYFGNLYNTSGSVIDSNNTPQSFISHRFIGGNEDKSELLIFQGNNSGTDFGPDRIKLIAPEIYLSTFSTANLSAAQMSLNSSGSLDNNLLFPNRLYINKEGLISCGNISNVAQTVGNLTMSGVGRLRSNVLTTTQRDTLTGSDGDIVFNSTLNVLQVYYSAGWHTITSV